MQRVPSRAPVAPSGPADVSETAQVIKGWDQGVLGMRVGERIRLTVPPALGYGKRGSGKEIPGGATLIFDMTLNKIL